MTKLFYTILLCNLVAASSLSGQSNAPEINLSQEEVKAHVYFLASDALMGRRTGEYGNKVAAQYIAAQFQMYGVKPVPGNKDYFQQVSLRKTPPMTKGSITYGATTFTQGDNMLFFTGKSTDISTGIVFAGHGWIDSVSGHNDYQNLDVKGKIVVVQPGKPGQMDPQTVFNAMRFKRNFAKERGAVALFELYQLSFPWNFFKSYFNTERIELAGSETPDLSFIYGWINEGDSKFSLDIQGENRTNAKLVCGDLVSEAFTSPNVIGIIEGSDPSLKNEYVLVSAHFDHVGTGKNGGQAYTPEDSIFNGTRDNAIGTTGLLIAAKYLSMNPPKRSVILLAVTGEELGLLGSEYYAEHPLIPLKQVIYNLNCDGAGYNDTTVATLIGMGRTGADDQIRSACDITGLKLINDPAPEQGLFDRSDNVSFAARGIPAPTFSLGFTAFDKEINTYYHQAADNPESVNYSYLRKFTLAFVHAARLIADRENRPQWTPGDKYEEAGKLLYGN